MSEKLDKSLDELLARRRQNARRGTNRRASASKATTPAVPVGGVKKTTKTANQTGKAAQIGRSSVPTTSKIIVSGLPSDVTEANIKEYFSKAAGPVKKVMLTYNQNGTSRGIASIIFAGAETAAKAAREQNGLLVDGTRPMKIEVVVDASHAPEIAAPKPLTERVAQAKRQPQSKPKPATATKTANAARGRGRARGSRRSQNTNRPKPKTAEELDAEMVDYFNENTGMVENGAGAGTNGAAAVAAGGEDMGMAEISVSTH